MSSATPPFWAENPNVLLNVAYITELFPTDEMTYSQKLNAVSRFVCIFAIGVYIWTKNIRALVFGGLSLLAVYLVYFYEKKEKRKVDERKAERFANLDGETEDDDPALYALKSELPDSPAKVFDMPNDNNPFNNVLITDVGSNPHKKPAPPSYNARVNDAIVENAKQAVVNMNVGNNDVDKLFTNLGEQLAFEQSMRQFYSTPSTTTPDDQQSFAEFCYGSMISCAEGNKFACARNAAAMRHNLS